MYANIPLKSKRKEKKPNLRAEIIALIIILLIMGFMALKSEAIVITPQDTQKEDTGEDTTSQAMIYEGIEVSEMMIKIIDCESKWDSNARGAAGEIGLAQFMPRTFDWMSGLAGKDLDIYSDRDQIWLLRWGLQNGLAHHWTCHRIIYGY